MIPGEYTEPIEPGDMLPPSKLWVDGEQTDEDLEGTSGRTSKATTLKVS